MAQTGDTGSEGGTGSKDPAPPRQTGGSQTGGSQTGGSQTGGSQTAGRSAGGRPFVTGYAGNLTARPGAPQAVMLTADVVRRADASLVRLGTGSAGGGFGQTSVRSLGTVRIDPQETQTGSCLVADGARRDWAPGAFAAAVRVSPTRLGSPQVLLGQTGIEGSWWLGMDAGGCPRASAAAGGTACHVTAPDALVEGAWYLVAAGFDPATGLRLAVRPLPVTPSWRVAVDAAMVPVDVMADGPVPLAGLLNAALVVGAREVPAGGHPDSPPRFRYRDCVDGRLELPLVLSGGLDNELLAALAGGPGEGAPATAAAVRDRLLVGWDFARRLTPGRVRGCAVPGIGSAACAGILWNTPLEGSTASGWTGNEQDYRQAPAEYGAVHFHADDLDDCRWAPTIEIEVEPDLPSGVYAVRLDATGELSGEPAPADPLADPPADPLADTGDAGDSLLVDHVVFFVSSARGSPAAPLLFLAPTASYLAYANDHPATDGDFSEATASRTPVIYEDDLLLDEHREWGLSCYDSHLDGSGVAISSARRPLVNMRPAHRYHVGPWQLPADLALLDWLAEERIPYDVATDEDLHRDGAAVLARYPAVLSGTHPEYYSTAMLDGLEAYLGAGGRLCHLGANGYYWRVAFDADRPWVMELRRGQAGSRAWESAPGEGHLTFSGERAGLWRHLGRPPQRLTGVGYAAQGFDRCGWFRRQPDSYDPRVAFLFDGVEGDTFGTAGDIGGGAVGQELDRYDGRLGTSRDALLLATSEGLTEGYQRCVEEILFTVPGTNARIDPDVRADVVYQVKPGGGAVFAAGSIAWAGALRRDPGVAAITRNLLRRFADPAPLPW